MAEAGGALYFQAFQDGVTLTQVLFEENKVVVTGGAIFLVQTIIDEISKSVFRNNECSQEVIYPPISEWKTLEKEAQF